MGCFYDKNTKVAITNTTNLSIFRLFPSKEYSESINLSFLSLSFWIKKRPGKKKMKSANNLVIFIQNNLSIIKMNNQATTHVLPAIFLCNSCVQHPWHPFPSTRCAGYFLQIENPFAGRRNREFGESVPRVPCSNKKFRSRGPSVHKPGLFEIQSLRLLICLRTIYLSLEISH